MAFVKVNKSAMGSQSRQAEIRLGWHIQSEKNKTRSIYLSTSRDIVDQLGWKVEVGPSREGTGVRSTTRIAVHEGTGSDAGFLMLEYDEYGYALGSNKSDPKSIASFTVNISVTRLKHYAINDILIEKQPEPVEFTIDEKEGTILIQVPDWLRYNPQTVEPEPEPEPEPVVEKKSDTPLRLNREERRRIAKTVASRIGR